MDEQPKTTRSFWERSTIGRVCRWVFSARGMRRIFIVIAWIVTLIALFYGEENWRGRHAWNQYREATEASGESLDFTTYIPKTVPDDENFAAIPFLQSFLAKQNEQILTNDLYARAGNRVVEDGTPFDRLPRHFRDLAGWQMAALALQSGTVTPGQRFQTRKTSLADRVAAAPAVLEGLQIDQPVFAELRAASTREFSRYPVNYEMSNPGEILLPHLAKIMGVCRRLSLESCADLALGRSDEAAADVMLNLAMADSIKTEPFLISILVRVAAVQLAVQPVWEGLAERQWTDAQLQVLQARFESYDFLTDMQLPLKGEHAMGVMEIASVQKLGVAALVPSGWWWLEKLNYENFYDDEMKGVVDLAAKTISPAAAEADASALAGIVASDHDFSAQRQGNIAESQIKAFLRHRLMAAVWLPGLKNFYPKIAAAQVATDEAELACALERYRLANGQYPETLEALTPRFIKNIPNDVIGGQPYKYRRTEDGRFLLYSVGWNEKDDGGVPGKTLFDRTQGDWVWTYPGQ